MHAHVGATHTYTVHRLKRAMTASDDPAFLSAPAVARNPVGPLVTGEDALGSKEEYPVVVNEGDNLDAPESNIAM